MRKNIFLTFLLLLIGINFLPPKISLAATSTGTFKCNRTITGPCLIDNNNTNCASGYSDGGACASGNILNCDYITGPCVVSSSGSSSTPLSSNTPVQITTLSGATGLNTSLDNIGSIISLAVKFLFPIAGIILLFYLVAGGFQIMLSSGDPKAMEGGQKKITNAIIGFVIIFIAFWLVVIISKIFGISVISTIFT